MEIQHPDSESKLLKELNKLNIYVPILQAIKEVLELNKMVKELCIKKGGKQIRFTQKLFK